MHKFVLYFESDVRNPYKTHQIDQIFDNADKSLIKEINLARFLPLSS